MRCSKCQYISFEASDRCRNCGYEFSLAVDAPPLDLTIHDTADTLGPLADFALDSTARVTSAPPATTTKPLTPRSVRQESRPLDLPLFGGAPGSRIADAPRRAAAPAEAPPAVRRPMPTPRPATRPIADRAPRLDLESPPVPRPAPEAAPAALEEATLARRLWSGLLDMLILGGIDLVVVHFTLRLCDLGWSEVRALPAVPLIAFFTLLNGGYVATFVAASGQTIGKMITGIRIVAADAPGSPPAGLPFGQAAVRGAVSVFSVALLGLGFVPALAGSDRRALHDRLANTRVVKA